MTVSPEPSATRAIRGRWERELAAVLVDIARRPSRLAQPEPQHVGARQRAPAAESAAAYRKERMPQISSSTRDMKNAPRTSRGADVEIPTQATSGVDPVDSIAHCITSDASDRALGAQSNPGLACQFGVRAEVAR